MNTDLSRRLLVLLVDDSEFQIAHERVLLEDQPFDFIVAHNGIEALAAARRFQPDVILLDIEMPVMSGLETVAALRACADTAGVPVIMVSARTDGEPVERAFLGGCDDFVTKPVHKDELVAKIHSLTGVAAGA